MARFRLDIEPAEFAAEIAARASEEELAEEFTRRRSVLPRSSFSRRTALLGRRGAADALGSGFPRDRRRPPRRPIRHRRGWPLVVDAAPLDDRAQPGSEYVRWVQLSLNRLLGIDLAVDGVMNAEARAAIRRFQRQNQLPADGIAGPETRQALIEARKKLARSPSGRLRG